MPIKPSFTAPQLQRLSDLCSILGTATGAMALRPGWQEVGMGLYDVALGWRQQEIRWDSGIMRVRACGALKTFLTNAERTEEHEIYVRFDLPLDIDTLKRTLQVAWNSPEPIKIKSGRERGTGILDTPTAVREVAGRGHLSAFYDRDYDQLRAEYLARVRGTENDPQVGEVAEQEEDL